MENEDDSLPYIDDTTDEETNNNHYNLKIIENYQNKNRNIEITNAYPYDFTNKPPNALAPLADEDDVVDFHEDTIKHPVNLSQTGMKLVIKSWNSSVSIQGLDNKSSITFRRKPEKAHKRISKSEERKIKSENEDAKVVEKPKKGRWKVLTRSLMLAKSARLERRGLDERYPKYVLLKNEEEEEPPKIKENYPKMFTFEKKSDFKGNEIIEPKSEFSFKRSFKNKTKPIVPMEEILKENTSTIEPEIVKSQKKVLTERKHSVKKIERRKSLSVEKLATRKDDKQEKSEKCHQGRVFREIQGIIEDTLKLVPPSEGIHQEANCPGCHLQEKQLEYGVSPQFCQYSCPDPYCTAGHSSTYVPVYAQAQPKHLYRNVNSKRECPLSRHCEVDSEQEADVANLQFGFLSSFFPRVLILKAVQGQSFADETEMTKDHKPLSQNEDVKVEVEEEYAKPVETLEVPQQDLTLKSKLVQEVTVTDPEVEFFIGDLEKTNSILDEDQKTKTDDSETTEYLNYCEYDPPDNESVERLKISTPPSSGRDKINDENSKNLTLTKIGYKMYDNLTKLSLNREKEIIEKAEVSGCGCNGNKAKKLPCNITLESNNNVVKVTVPENELNFQIVNSEGADILVGVTSRESKNKAKEEEEKKIVRRDELWHSDDGKRVVVLRQNQQSETDVTSGSQKLKLSLADDKEVLLSIEMNEKNKKQDTIKPKSTKETKVGTDDFDIAGGDFICTFGENYKNLSPRTAHLLKSLHEKLKIGEQERKFLEEKINQKITDQIYENKILPGLFLIKQISPRPQICKKPAEASLRKPKKETEKENQQLREYYCEDCLATMRIFEDSNPSVKKMRQKKKSEEAKLEQEKQEACVKCSKLQNGRHGSFEETETQTKQTTLSTLKSVLKRSASHKKDKVSKNPEKLVAKDMQIVGKKTKNRVQFDETQNKYFEADYVILIHEEDYDLDDYYDEGSPFDDEDDDSYDDGMAGPKICCSNPNCNNLISLTNYADYGDPNNGLVGFKYARGDDRDRFDFSSRYYDVNYEEINQNLKKSSTNATNRCENEKCQNCNNYFDFEVSKLDTSQDFSDQVTLSPPEGYKDGGSQCCPHYGLQYHNTVNDIAREGAGSRSLEFQDGENHCDYEEEDENVQEFDKNEVPSQDETKINVLNREETESIMQQEDKSEKPKQRFIVETITMTTVTERRIVREASDSTTEDSSSQNDDLKRSGILKGGKFWKNSTEKPPGKTVNYTENVNFKEGNEENDEGLNFVENIEKNDAATTPEETDKKSIELLDEKKKIEEDAASPDSTELTLTFKLGQHLLIANSLKPNSAMRQLFPSPRFLSPPPLEDIEGAETKKPVPPKQFLVTAESLRLFEEAKKSKILGNMNSEDAGQSFIAIMPPMSKNDDDVQNNRLSKTIERNTLRRSLIKYSYEYRNKRLSEKKKNEHSLEERIRQLTCGVDDDEETQEKKPEDGAEGISPRSSPQGEESKDFSRVDVKSSRHVDTASPMSNSSSSSSSTYRKLTDLFSRRTNPQPVSEDINRNIKAETIQCDLVLNSQSAANSVVNNQGSRGNILSVRKMSLDNKKQFLSPLAPLTACVNAENQLPGGGHAEYSLQDIDDGLKEEKKLGVQPDVIAETPQNETSNDELAAFAQQGAGRIEKLKKRYSAADDKSDDDDDYGFNKRPLVRGIKPQLDSNEAQNTGPAACNTKPATTTATTTTIHTSWPYYSQENSDPKLRYPPRPEDGTQYGAYNNSQDYRGYAEMGNANYVEYQAVGQQRINYVNQTQQSLYSTTNTYYRCQPIRFAGTGYSELSNYQFRHPPHSPPPVRRIITTPQPSPIPSEDGRIRNADNRVFNRNSETYGYTLGTNENCIRPKVGLPEVGIKGTPPTSEGVKNSDTVFNRRTMTNVHNPCLQMKFSPVNYHQGAVPTASIRFSASCSPHAVVDESNVIIEPHYSTFPQQNTVGVIRVGQGQQMIRVPVPYSTGTPVQVHLMAGRLGRCDSPQRPSSPQGVTKVPIQPYNQYLIAKGTQTAQVQSFSVPPKSTPDGAPVPEAPKTVDFEKQGKAIAEELQTRQKIALSRSLSQEAKHQKLVPIPNPGNLMVHQERGVPEGAASSTVQDTQPPNLENATPEAPGNAVYYTMNV